MKFFKQIAIILMLFAGVLSSMGSEKLIPLKTFKFLPEMSDREAWEAIKNDPTKKNILMRFSVKRDLLRQLRFLLIQPNYLWNFTALASSLHMKQTTSQDGRDWSIWF